jgi:hypothetical protein
MPADWFDFRDVMPETTSASVVDVNDFRGSLILFRTLSINTSCSGEEGAFLGKKELLKAASI